MKLALTPKKKNKYQSIPNLLDSMIMMMICFMQVSQLLKFMPNEFNTELLLAMCDLKTTTGRKVASKAIAQNAKFQSTATAFAARQHTVS